jgi:hypothetical protein
MTRKTRMALVLALLGAALYAQGPGAASRPAADQYVDAVVAKVNRAVITKSQVYREIGFAAVSRLSPADYDREFHRRLVQVVFAAIQQDAVEKVGLVVPKHYIAEQLEQEKEQKGAAQILESIKEKGYKSEEEYLEAFGREQSQHTFLAAQAGQFGAKAPQFRPDYWVEPSATEIRRFYRQHVADQFTQKNQAHVFAIVLPYLAFADPPEPKKEIDPRTGVPHVAAIAQTIKEELARGTSFATLARRYGHEFKAEEGGDLGWIDAGNINYQKELVDYAFKGPLKQLSDPIPFPTPQTPRGVIVVWVEDRATERVMPFAEAQVKIQEGLRKARVGIAEHKIVQKLLAEAYVAPPDLKREMLRLYGE